MDFVKVITVQEYSRRAGLRASADRRNARRSRRPRRARRIRPREERPCLAARASRPGAHALSSAARQPHGLRLDFNENTVGCSPRVFEACAVSNAMSFPAIPIANRRSQVAAFLGARPAKSLLTNGVDEAIHLLCETYLERRRSPYRRPHIHHVRDLHAGHRSKVITMPADDDFSFPIDEPSAAASQPRTRMIAIANPNNPTGTAGSPRN